MARGKSPSLEEGLPAGKEAIREQISGMPCSKRVRIQQEAFRDQILLSRPAGLPRRRLLAKRLRKHKPLRQMIRKVLMHPRHHNPAFPALAAPNVLMTLPRSHLELRRSNLLKRSFKNICKLSVQLKHGTMMMQNIVNHAMCYALNCEPRLTAAR